MLVLSRKKDEIVVINDNIQVIVLEIKGDKCRLGFIAPKEIPVHRKEIWEKLREQDREEY